MRICKIAFISIFSLLLVCGKVYSDIDLSGSAYNETSLINQDGKIRYGNRSSMHLNGISQTKGVKLVSELELYTLHGYLISTNSLLAEFLKGGQFYIDRLYMKFPVYMVDLTLGKQRIAWGTGLLYRPTDNLNKPNPLSLSGRKEGVNALLAKAYIGDLSAVEFVVAPADTYREIDGETNLGNLKYSKFAGRYTTNFLKSDVGLSYQYNGEDKDHIFGLDMKGDIKLGYHLETTFTYNQDSFESENIEKVFQSVVGLDYSFAGKWIVLGEYFYNGRGFAEKTALPVSDFLLLDEFKYRHYLYSQVTYQHDVFLNGNLLLILNLVDKSLIVSPNVGYKLFQNTNLQLSSQIFFGDKDGEFSPERLGINQVYYVRLTIKF